MLRGHFRSEYGITAELSLEGMLTNRNVIDLYLNKLYYWAVGRFTIAMHEPRATTSNMSYAINEICLAREQERAPKFSNSATLYQ